MAKLTKYAGTVTQTTGGSYCSWSNLANIKNNTTGSYATSNGRIKGKSSSPNRPSPVMCTNFSFNLPTGAEVSKVTVEYRHRKEAYNGNVCNIPAPTISLLGVSGFSGKGSAPTTTMTTYTKSFSASKITRSQVNSSSFGVKIDYPANTNSYEGTMSISLVRVTVEYKTPSYTVSVKKASGGYNNEEYAVECSISNKNLTAYNPTLTLSAPAGFSYKRAEGTGTATRVNNRTVTWNPNLTSKTGTSTIRMVFDVDVIFPVLVDGPLPVTGTFTLSENLNSTTGSYTATITERPVTEDETNPDAPLPDGGEAPVNEMTTINVIAGNDFKLNFDDMFQGTPSDPTVVITFGDCTEAEVTYDGTYTSKNHFDYEGITYTTYTIASSAYPFNGNWTLSQIKTYEVWVSYAFQESFFINVMPSEDDLTVPFLTLLEPTTEELDRLGDGFEYIAQSDMKHITTDTSNRDWYKNNRIGIFNNKPKPLFEDKAVTGNKNTNWTNYSNRLTVTVDEAGTLLSRNQSSNGYYFVNNASFTFSDFICEFDIVSLVNQCQWYIQNSSSSNQTVVDFASYDVVGKHIKIVSEDSVMTFYADDVQFASVSISSVTAPFEMGFRINASTSERYMKFKNFVVYDTLTDINNLSPQQIFENAEYWANTTGGLNEYNSVECEFTYNEDYPLYIIMTGDYPETTSLGFDGGDVSFTEPCIIEKAHYNGREANGNYPVPIDNLISDSDSSTITLSANETGTPVRLYDFPLDDDYGTNEGLAIRGIQVIGTLESSDNLILYAKLINPNGEIGQRSIMLNTNDTDSFNIGGLGDLWGFTTLQMTNLEDWQIELSASNILATGESYLNIQDVQVIFYIETIDKQQITISIDGEDIAYYGAFIESVNIPEGLNTDTGFITVDGTDMNDAYRQNIREKTITVDFNISECDLKTSTDLLRQITKLFTNEKDQYNRPIPKRITFSHYPEDYFEYIMETPFEVSTEITDYNVTAKLTIPAGTSYSRTDTVTNTVGNANGLAALRPIITIQPSGSNIEIKEGLSEQSFTMSYGGTWTDKIVEINCDDRQVLLKDDADDEGIDISKYVDHNSDWFRLSGEFNFEAINCVIRTVSFNERW